MDKKLKGVLDNQKTKEKIQEPQKRKEIGLTIPLEKLPGVYSNVAIIHHTRNEFVLDFILNIAGQASFVSRVITNPEHIKKLNNVLTENIKKYEEKFGKIKIID